MPLRRGGHRLDARIDHAHRPAHLPGRDREERLHRDVELAAEAAAAAGGPDAHVLGRNAEHARGLVAVHVGRLGAGDDLDRVRAGGRGVAGLGLDIGVLDEARAERAFGRCAPLGRLAGIRIAAAQAAAGQDVVGPRGVERRRAVGERRLDAGERHERRPGDRNLRLVDAIQRLARADEPEHRFAAEAHFAGREDRLVLGVREDAEGVLARHVGRRDDRLEPGVPGSKRFEVAERERRARMRRADDAQPQRLRRRLVGAEFFAAGHLRPAVEPGNARADAGFPSPRMGEGQGWRRERR